MKILIYEGISGSGKTSLISNIKSIDNYEYIQIHRFTPTQWVYDHVYNRRDINYEFLNKGIQLLVPTYVIWCDCDEEIALKRQQQKMENDKTEPLLLARKYYHEYFSTISSFKKVLYLDTGKLTIWDEIEKIKEFLKS